MRSRSKNIFNIQWFCWKTWHDSCKDGWSRSKSQAPCSPIQITPVEEARKCSEMRESGLFRRVSNYKRESIENWESRTIPHSLQWAKCSSLQFTLSLQSENGDNKGNWESQTTPHVPPLQAISVCSREGTCSSLAERSSWASEREPRMWREPWWAKMQFIHALMHGEIW